MTRVFSIVLQNEEGKTKKYKDFDASTTAEQRIASALYDGYKKIKGKGTIYITKYYADGYSFWYVKDGVFYTDVITDSDVKDLNSDIIKHFFEEYKEGRQKPLEVKEAYSMLKDKRDAGLTEIDVSKVFNYDFRTFEPFIADIKAYPQKYNKKVVAVCKVVYANSSSLYGTEITEGIPTYPSWLQPKGFESERTGHTTWKMSAELDGHLVKATVTYDSKGIDEYGPVGTTELAGKLVKNYVLHILEDAYKQYTENNIDYKIIQVVNLISRYLDYVRGEDFRANYNKTGGKMKTPDEFMVDMTELLRGSRDNRLTKNDVYAVMNYFKHNARIFEQYYEQSNKCMEHFYPWFEGRVLRGQKLFRNVPK